MSKSVRYSLMIAVLFLFGVMTTMFSSPAEAFAAGEAPPEGEIAFESTRNGNSDIYVINADGTNERRLTLDSARDRDPQWSPDGSQIAFVSERDGGWEIFVMEADGGNVQQLTQNDYQDESPTWSPDGTQIAFVSYPNENFDLYLMNADGSGIIPLYTGVNGDYTPQWSPDGKDIVFMTGEYSDHQIAIIDTDGENLRVLTSGSENWWPSWSPDGSQIAFHSNRDGNQEIYTMNADGSDQTRLTNNPAIDEDPAWSPDGTQIAFISVRDSPSGVYVMDADGGNVHRITTLTQQATNPSWRPNVSAGDDTTIGEATADPGADSLIGQIAFSVHIDGGNLYLLDIDTNQRQPVIPRLVDTGEALISHVSWSPDGAQIVLQANYPDAINWSEIAILDVAPAHLERITNDQVLDSRPIWSPDGSHFLYINVSRTADFFLIRTDGTDSHPLLDNEFSRKGSERNAAWSTTGWLVFDADWNDRNDIYIMQMDGLTPLYDTLQLLTPMDGNHFAADWSPDGTHIVFQSDMHAVDSGSNDLYVYDVASGEFERLTFTEAYEFAPTWSPDGRFIAYTSGRPRNIYIMDMDTREVWRAVDIPESIESLDWRPVLPANESVTEE